MASQQSEAKGEFCWRKFPNFCQGSSYIINAAIEAQYLQQRVLYEQIIKQLNEVSDYLYIAANKLVCISYSWSLCRRKQNRKQKLVYMKK